MYYFHFILLIFIVQHLLFVGSGIRATFPDVTVVKQIIVLHCTIFSLHETQSG